MLRNFLGRVPEHAHFCDLWVVQQGIERGAVARALDIVPVIPQYELHLAVSLGAFGDHRVDLCGERALGEAVEPRQNVCCAQPH
eukprot:scaffold312656_cov32-Tisochrysis_lutea.AAC.5